MRVPAILAVPALAAALAACAPVDPGEEEKKGYKGTPPLGVAISADELAAAQTFTDATVNGEWKWIPFADAICADGSSTGLAVSPGTGDDLVVFLDGGGACWSFNTCELLNTAVDARYGPTQFATEIADYFDGSLLDREMLPPALAGATLVFVPYCTGDIHGGDAQTDYAATLISVTWRHRGHANVMAYLKRLAATWPNPDKLVVAGSSAGGFGALANYEAFRWYYPTARGYLLDDSGPALVGSDLSSALRASWYGSWTLGASLDVFCPECRDDMSLGYLAISKEHPADRIALLSHIDDSVMATFLQVPTTFGSDLGQLADVLEGTSNARVFLVPGYSHMLLTPLTANASSIASKSHDGVTLATWLSRMVSDDAAWASVR